MREWGESRMVSPLPFRMTMNEGTEGVSIASDVEMVSVGLHSDLLLRLDCYCDQMRQHPACPEEVNEIPFWAFRSNVIQAAVGFFLDDPELPLFELD